ncbi:hypothetical protein RFX53_19505, partial [Acinetobacter baumannii]|nr:hypothetical protein [Acinetobacter baumannii]
MFSLPIHEHGIPFHFFICSLVKFIPRYFILFVALVNGIVFLSSLSASLLLVHKNTTDFFQID